MADIPETRPGQEDKSEAKQDQSSDDPEVHPNSDHTPEKEDRLQDKKPKPKPVLVVDKCPHSDKEYYANGMCKNCYHLKGRNKKATGCSHVDRLLYAKGMCKNCYLSIYNKERRRKKKELRKQLKEQQKLLKAQTKF